MMISSHLLWPRRDEDMRLGKDIACILQCTSVKICISNQSLLRKPNTVRFHALPLASRACLSVSCKGECAAGQHPDPAPSGKWVEVVVCYSCWDPLLCRHKSAAATATANHVPQRSGYSVRNQFHATRSPEVSCVPVGFPKGFCLF